MAQSIKSIGKFQVQGTLGQGAHSTILQVRRLADSKTYALKVVPINGPDDRKFQDQAQLEFKVGGMVEHPSLIKIYALETVRDWLFRPRKLHLLIEYVNGKTLDTLQRLSIPKLVKIFVQVAAGLVHMHRRGVYHADLKPNNIILARSGEVKIIDFGLAWLRGQPKGRVQGTPEYMAPEQVKDSIVNERTDIYNFGATMYRLVTLRLPPSALGELRDLPVDSKTRLKLLKPVDQLNPEAPPELCKLIHACLSPNAAKRPEKMSEIQGTLDHLADQLAVGADATLEELV